MIEYNYCATSTCCSSLCSLVARYAHYKLKGWAFAADWCLPYPVLCWAYLSCVVYLEFGVDRFEVSSNLVSQSNLDLAAVQ